MLKGIDLTAHPAVIGTRASQAEAPAAPAGPHATFAAQFQSAQTRTSEATRQALLAEIDSQAQRLVKHPVAGEVARYRTLVGQFLKEAVGEFSGLSQHMDRRNRVFTLVQEVDKQLSELTDMLLKGQAKPLDVLAKLDEIRGMLVDLLA
ncbi:MAG: YaaR family protein [Candidatus Sericytochromatia bacterium]|nr:YaaR family protein [Candidatus Sericytochromatia bacterium]